MNDHPSILVETFGGYQQAVDGLMEFSRAIWSHFNSSKHISSRSDAPYYVMIGDADIWARSTFTPDLQVAILESMRHAGLSGGRYGSAEAIVRPAFQPLTLLRQLLQEVRPDHELRYFAMMNIRMRFSCEISSDFGNCFQILSSIVNHMISGTAKDFETTDLGASHGVEYDQFLERLQFGLERATHTHFSPASIVDAFIECCQIMNYVQPHRKIGFLSIRTDRVDSAYLLSNLFGMTTGIVGFDELFGGGGLILPDAHVSSLGFQMKGRAVLALGRYGSGKSLLSLQFAFEVARKGGVAYILSVEQTPDEYLYGLSSISPLPPRELVDVIVTPESRQKWLHDKKSGRGALIIVNPIRESFEDFMITFRKDLNLFNDYKMKLIVIDPVNAIVRDMARPSELRNETLTLFEEAKAAGFNIWLAAEEVHAASTDLHQEQNIADTVIRLSVDRVQDYAQRYFEITKSRHQREQRGRHAFSIVPGQGIRIFPSTAAVRARIRPRSIKPPTTIVSFGLRSLDEILGEDAISAGDVIVLQGAPGLSKTLLGLQFLLGTDLTKGGYANRRTTQSLLVGGRDNIGSVQHLLRNHFHHSPQQLRKPRGGRSYVRNQRWVCGTRIRITRD